VDGQRGYPDNNSEPRWYGSGPSYGESDWSATRGGDYAAGQPAAEPYRPEPRPYEDPASGRFGDATQPAGALGGAAGGLSGTSAAAPTSGARYETAAPTSGARYEPGRPPVPEAAQPAPGPADQPHFQTQPMDRAGLRVDADGGAGNVYRTRRPAAAVVIGVVVLVFEIVALRVFATAMTASPVSSGGAVSGMFLLAGLPLFGMGLYALMTGAAGAGRGPWLRTPLVYLPVGLVLLVCGALAAA
jgi:hypothetical protein